ncbi:amidase family protein [Luteimonas suaedae]|uniref:amidase family protein n=1 Tax=Luteimonas suaedae TaxID=2605430 RepID=UPI001658D36E|nr:amidase family protein [Luteimonas suaedae]
MRDADAMALGRLDAHAQAALVRAGELSPAELVAAAIMRAERLDPALGALSHRAFDAARERAAALRPGADAALAGVPWLAKDSLDHPGMPTRAGSRSGAEILATAAPAFVQRLSAQGLVAIGKSAMPEFGLLPSTEPLLGPVTRNPWSPAHSPGGSSGGAAAAVAAGIVPLAHGSDGAGSIRMPAACCGVVGLKPGRGGVVRARAPHLLEDLLVGDGLLARSVRDAAWAFAVARPVLSAPVAAPSPRRLRIGVVAGSLQGDDPHPEVARALSAAAVLCAELGHTVEIARLPVDVEAVAEALRTLWSQLAADSVDRVTAQLGARAADRVLEPWTRQLAAWHRRHCGTDALERAFAQLGGLPAAFAGFHRDCDVLLTPVVRTPPPPLGTLAPDRDFEALLAAVFDWMSYTPLQNLAGTPAISLPLATSADGLPVGVQFAADRGGEDLLLALAYALEAAAPWHGRWPPHSVASHAEAG